MASGATTEKRQRWDWLGHLRGAGKAREAAVLDDDTGKVGARVWRVRRQRSNESTLGLGRKLLWGE